MRIPGVPYVQGRGSYRDADDRKFGIAIHCTANTASDSAEASYATRRTDGTSAHLYCDADSVTQSLDTEAKAGHAGSGNGNENAYAVEITGLTSWTREQWLARVAWDRLAYCLAWLIRNDRDLAGFQVRRASVAEMKSNPKVRALYGHDDMRRAWGGTDHTDPGPNFPWDRLLQAVNAALGGAPTESSTIGGGFLVGLSDKDQENIRYTLLAAPNGPAHVRDGVIVQKLDSVLAQLADLAGKPAPPATLVVTDEQLAQLAKLIVDDDNDIVVDEQTLTRALTAALSTLAARAAGP